jgi:hypothetical protein
MKLAGVALDCPRHLIPAAGVCAVDHDPVPRPQVSSGNDLLLGDVVDDVNTFPCYVVVTKVVVE